jgi:hypothetical protein
MKETLYKLAVSLLSESDGIGADSYEALQRTFEAAGLDWTDFEREHGQVDATDDRFYIIPEGSVLAGMAADDDPDMPDDDEYDMDFGVD